MRSRRCLNASSTAIFEYKVSVRFFLGETHRNKNTKSAKILLKFQRLNAKNAIFFKNTHFVKVLLHNLELRILKNTR